MYFSAQVSIATVIKRIALAAAIIVVGIENAQAHPDNHASKISTSEIAPKLLRHATSKNEAAGIFKSTKSTFHGDEVSGLGIPAYRTAMPAQLNVLKGHHWLIISAGTFKDPAKLAQEKLARIILPKISEQ